ncbi:MAG TPA: FISUMP domain-containing protein [Bacteroidales bacterium]|nr:FISUMP domain-containing protein [Bacteroidales bacterium]HSA44178.1 FISUMP domain-containing protein [Bacteroidales bacterium]
MKSFHLFSLLLFLSFIMEFPLKGHSVVQNVGVISGCVRYANADSTVIRHARVLLTDDQNTPVDSAFTDADGSFTFTGLAQGSYILTACPVHPAGGINAVDALEVLKHFVGMVTLEGLPLIAADVNLSASVNSVDALLVQKKFVELIPSFPAADWVSNQKTISISYSDTAFSTLKVICTGDVNGSYVPDNNLFLFCGDTLLDVRDGQKYPTVQIGNQCWMQRNLNFGNRVPCPAMSNNGIPEKCCAGNMESQCDIWGGLYRMGEMMQWDTIPGLQGLCPAGFHVPTNTEWDELTDFLGGSAIAGGKMKETGTAHWQSPNVGATNESGFTALGSGSNSGVQFSQCLMWSSTPFNFYLGWCTLILSSQTDLFLLDMTQNLGISIRCLRD